MKKKLVYIMLLTLYFSPERIFSTENQNSPSNQITPASKNSNSVGFVFDCIHDFNKHHGSSQNCVSISGIKLKLVEKFQDDLTGSISINPYSTLNQSYDLSVLEDKKPLLSQYTSLGPIESYQLVWSPRKNLAITFELYNGATVIPDYSGLSTKSFFANSGWKQSAWSITYFLTALEGIKVKFIGGNGEGEIDHNFDPQQYIAFELNAKLIKGIEFLTGFSLDLNSSGSVAQNWFEEQNLKNCGLQYNDHQKNLLREASYSSRRMSATIATNEDLSFARGLKLAASYHKSIYADLNHKKKSQPSLSELDECEQIDPNLIFIEDPNQEAANTMQHTSIIVGGSYRLLGNYFLGFEYQKQKIDSDIEFFQICDSYDEKVCLNPSSRGRTLERWSYSFGGGIKLTEGLQLTISYYTSSFAHPYKKIYYTSNEGRATKSKELYNVRLSYNWE